MNLLSLPTDISIPQQYRTFADEYIATMARYFQPVTGERKICIHGAGIPGAGKSTKLRQYLHEHPEWKEKHHFIAIGNDDVMQAMPDYQASLRDDGDEAAFRQFEVPASAICYELLRRAVQNNFHLLIDHSATAEYRPKLLLELRQHGYYLVMVHVHCEIEEALRRSEIRRKKEKRFVPAGYFIDRLAILQRLLPIYKEIVDEFHTIDNTAPI